MPATGAVNIATALTEMAARRPDADAILCPVRGSGASTEYRRLTYLELDEDSDRIARGLARMGIRRGTRTVLMVRPSPDFFALTFALFKAGAVPVIVDPGMGIRPVGRCLEEAQPEAFIGIAKAHVARLLFSWAWRSVTTCIAVGTWFGGKSLDAVRELGASAHDVELPATRADDVAAILFTSGSTGAPKGAVYTHGNFAAQVTMLRDTYGIEPGEIDLPTFPLFALFDPALGMTTIVPDMDFTRPGSVDPANILQPIRRFGVTNMFGSPALLRRVARHPATPLPSLKRVISAGAPVPTSTLEAWHERFVPDAEIFTPYGATEALPVASIGSREILGETAARTADGAGVCVGRIVAPNDVAIIRIDDGPLDEWDDALRVPDGEIGEIVVAGPTVTQAYFGRPAADVLAKIRDGDRVRHRMGDLGYFDDAGRLWFCGRKAHRVVTRERTLYPVCAEAVLNEHAGSRTALVGVPSKDGSQRAVLCLEQSGFIVGAPHADDSVPAKHAAELLRIAGSHSATRGIERILQYPLRFPVDARHNSKIRREAIAGWAATKA